MELRNPTKSFRCYAEREDGQWMAFCVDLTLAVQGESYEEVREKLHKQVISYVNEALTIDRDHAQELLNRRAPLAWMAKFHFYSFMSTLATRGRSKRKHRDLRQASGKGFAFKEKLPSAACMSH